MREYIKKLQNKSENTRKQILFVSLTIIMFLVGSIWFYGLSGRFGEKFQNKVKQEIKPFALFSDSVSSTYKNVSASVGNIPTLSEQKQDTNKQIDLIVVENPVTQ